MEAKTDIAGAKRKGLQGRLKTQLSRLRTRGMDEPKVSDLDDLAKLAAFLIPDGSPNQQVEALLEFAISAEYGEGSKKYEVVRLSFGLDDSTRHASVKERHEAAWKRYGENSLSNFTTHVTPDFQNDLARQLVSFFVEYKKAEEEAKPLSPPEPAKEDTQEEARPEERAKVPRPPAPTESDAEASAAPPGSGHLAKYRKLLASSSRSQWATAAVAMVFLVVATIYFLGVLDSSSSTPSIPPPGTVIDAQTGEIATHVMKQPPRQFAQLERGSIFRACNLATETPCTYPGHQRIPVHVGDVLSFGIRLIDPNATALPYASFLVAHQFGLLAQLEMTWPGDAPPPTSGEALRLRKAESVELALPKDFSGYEGLAYIPASTVLEDQNNRVMAQLPDGIMENGIALANIGSPASCFDCSLRYKRYIFFKARVGGTHYP